MNDLSRPEGTASPTPPDCAVPMARPLRLRTADLPDAEVLAIGWDSTTLRDSGAALPRIGFTYLVLDPRADRPTWIADDAVEAVLLADPGAGT